MDFVPAIRTCLSDYANFRGRAPRSEYWWFVLFVFLADAVGQLIDAGIGAYVFGPLISLALLIPQLAVSVRRLHDIDRLGWWLLIGIVPLIGWIVLIVWACKPGTPGFNRFGAPRWVLP